VAPAERFAWTCLRSRRTAGQKVRDIPVAGQLLPQPAPPPGEHQHRHFDSDQSRYCHQQARPGPVLEQVAANGLRSKRAYLRAENDAVYL